MSFFAALVVGMTRLLAPPQWSWFRREPRRPGRQPTDVAAIRSALDMQVARLSGRAAPDVMKAVVRLRATIIGLAERIDRLPVGSEDAFILKRTATHYLPSTLDAYLALPAAYAEQQPVDAGVTPKAILLRDLALMSAKLENIRVAINKGDTDRFLINARFLRDRFGAADDLRLPSDDSPDPGSS